MPAKEKLFTLVVPNLEGQYKLWKKEIVAIAAKSDEIIQLGNIVGVRDYAKDKQYRGPNAAMLNLTLLWRATFDNWLQIIGPNEIMALNFPDNWTNRESNTILRERWFQPDVPGAFQTAGVNKGRLVTHAGLTYGEWINIGRPDDPLEAAERLNEKYSGVLHPGDCYRFNGVPNFAANPIFADPFHEFYPSWVSCGEDIPFGQLVGSESLNSPNGREGIANHFSLLSRLDDVKFTHFGSLAMIKDRFFLSVNLDIFDDKIITKIVAPWRLYIERTGNNVTNEREIYQNFFNNSGRLK